MYKGGQYWTSDTLGTNQTHACTVMREVALKHTPPKRAHASQRKYEPACKRTRSWIPFPPKAGIDPNAPSGNYCSHRPAKCGVQINLVEMKV